MIAQHFHYSASPFALLLTDINLCQILDKISPLINAVAAYVTTVEFRSAVAYTTYAYATCPVALDAQIPPIMDPSVCAGNRAHHLFDAGTQSYALLTGPQTAILVHGV
jgi:hypothetical protein